MLYSCTHMATLGVKGLKCCIAVVLDYKPSLAYFNISLGLQPWTYKLTRVLVDCILIIAAVCTSETLQGR